MRQARSEGDEWAKIVKIQKLSSDLITQVGRFWKPVMCKSGIKHYRSQNIQMTLNQSRSLPAAAVTLTIFLHLQCFSARTSCPLQSPGRNAFRTVFIYVKQGFPVDLELPFWSDSDNRLCLPDFRITANTITILLGCSKEMGVLFLSTHYLFSWASSSTLHPPQSGGQQSFELASFLENLWPDHFIPFLSCLHFPTCVQFGLTIQ